MTYYSKMGRLDMAMAGWDEASLGSGWSRLIAYIRYSIVSDGRGGAVSGEWVNANTEVINCLPDVRLVEVIDE